MTSTGTPAEETTHQARSWLVRVVRIVAFVVVAAVLLAVWAAMAQMGWGDDGPPGVTESGQVELTRDQPVMAVEFEASFVSHRLDSGIEGKLSTIRPARKDSQVSVGTGYWDGEQWLSGMEQEITQVGLNTFRFRLMLWLHDGIDSATVPLDAKFYAIWSDGIDDYDHPEEDNVSDLQLKLVSTYPVE